MPFKAVFVFQLVHNAHKFTLLGKHIFAAAASAAANNCKHYQNHCQH